MGWLFWVEVVGIIGVGWGKWVGFGKRFILDCWVIVGFMYYCGERKEEVVGECNFFKLGCFWGWELLEWYFIGSVVVFFLFYIEMGIECGIFVKGYFVFVVGKLGEYDIFFWGVWSWKVGLLSERREKVIILF